MHTLVWAYNRLCIFFSASPSHRYSVMLIAPNEFVCIQIFFERFHALFFLCSFSFILRSHNFVFFTQLSFFRAANAADSAQPQFVNCRLYENMMHAKCASLCIDKQIDFSWIILNDVAKQLSSNFDSNLRCLAYVNLSTESKSVSIFKFALNFCQTPSPLLLVPRNLDLSQILSLLPSLIF